MAKYSPRSNRCHRERSTSRGGRGSFISCKTTSRARGRRALPSQDPTQISFLDFFDSQEFEDKSEAAQEIYRTENLLPYEEKEYMRLHDELRHLKDHGPRDDEWEAELEGYARDQWDLLRDLRIELRELQQVVAKERGIPLSEAHRIYMGGEWSEGTPNQLPDYIERHLVAGLPRVGSTVSMETIWQSRLAGGRARGRRADRPLHQIAREIRRDWGSKVNYAAVPYLDAMGSLSSIDDNYGYDSGSSIVMYFLSNARSWRGPKAKEIKAELKGMLK